MTIEEVLTDLQVPFLRAGHHHCRPGWIQIDCPFCGKDSDRFHLGYNLGLRYFNCWKCGAKFVDQVLRELGVASAKAREIHRSIESETVVPRERARVSLQVPIGLGPLLAAHRKYLRGRGFDPEVIEDVWKIKGIGISHELSWRIYIPIFLRARQVSWTTRAIGERVTQRYISASAEEESVNHKSVVYGRDFCRHSVVVVEGPIDAWAIGPGAGALFGTAFSSAQVRELVDIPNRFICFDSSKDAQNRAEELANQLACFPGSTENIQLDAKDPGSAPPKEIQLVRKAARL